MSWYQFAVASGHRTTADLCGNFIRGNFSLISANVDYPNLEVDALAGFLRRSDLVVEDEMALFGCLDKWLRGRREIMEKAGETHIDIHMKR